MLGLLEWSKYISNDNFLKTWFLSWQIHLVLRFHAHWINVDKNLVGSNHSEELFYSLVIYVLKILDSQVWKIICLYGEYAPMGNDDYLNIMWYIPQLQRHIVMWKQRTEVTKCAMVPEDWKDSTELIFSLMNKSVFHAQQISFLCFSLFWFSHSRYLSFLFFSILGVYC